MSNKRKLIILGSLLLILGVLIVSLIRVKDEQSNLKNIVKSNKSQEDNNEISTVEVVGESMITINADLSEELSVYDFKDELIYNAVIVAKDLINGYAEQGKTISDVTVFNISPVDVGTVGLYDAVVMYNIDLLLSPVDGEKFHDSSKYLIYLLRWDDDQKACYFVSSLSEAEIQSKYADFAQEFDDNVYTAACIFERLEFLKSHIQYNELELPDIAYAKAVAYSATADEISEVKQEDHTFHDSDNVRVFSFNTNIDSTVLKIAFQYFEETDGWAFLYATSAEK